jgi:hypothetical protein
MGYGRQVCEAVPFGRLRDDKADGYHKEVAFNLGYASTS